MELAERAFFQRLVASRYMTRQEACAAYAELLCACKDPRGAARSAGDAAGATEGALEAVVNRLNAVLREYDLAVQSARDEDGTPYVGLCNLAADDGLAQLATQYTAHELALFRKILFEGLLNEATPFYADGIVPLIDCINLCHDLHMSSPMAPTEAEAAIKRLVRDGWLRLARQAGSSHRRGEPTLSVGVGIRACLEIPEVRSWRMQRAQDVQTSPVGEGTDP
ncbi:hypothetical protein CDCA_CDCA01G0234 [Cyanidium caldarium]|uniref:Non-structural maintenance of chromosomes element 1 homolog n=1 Tax=Cyanidium caldarium TaxID=2771 RepID=A0AAV9IPF7_CYACA|nr:hypothetical protein CDCA_CDCA01G0234 [Cyanidium caldarium]